MKSIIRLSAIAVIFSVSVMCIASVQAQLRSPPRPLHEALRASQLKEVNANFHKAMEEGRIELDDWEKLDFTRPGEEGFGDNPEFEVFNPKSPRNILSSAKDEILSFPLIPQDKMDGIAIRPGLSLIFNLRRASYKLAADAGGDVTIDVIVAVLPYINPLYCSEPYQRYGLHIKPYQFHIPYQQEDNLRPFIEGYGPSMLSCNQPNSEQAHFLIPIARRIRISSDHDGAWRLLRTGDFTPSPTHPFQP